MDYKEKYEQALERAKKLYEQGTITESLGYVFPELQESKDERIRNFLIDFIKICTWTEKKDQGWPSREDCLAWLEKQSEKKPAEDAKALDADKVIEWLKITINERAENYGVYNETRLILSYNSIEDLINDFKEDFGL